LSNTVSGPRYNLISLLTYSYYGLTIIF